MNVLGTVQRMRREGEGLPFVEYRTRDLGVLLSDAEWGWSRHSDDAYVFAMYGLPAVRSADDYERSAEFHVEALKKAGETNRVWPCTHGEQARQERALRHASREAQIEASVLADTVVIPEPEFETGGRPPIRRGDKIQERVRRARERQPRCRRPIDPAEVFAREEKRHLA